MAIELFGTMVNLHPRFGNNFIDANTLDRTSSPEDEAVEKILALAERGEFTLLLPYSVQQEIEHPHTPLYVKRLATTLIYSVPVELTKSELETHRRISALIKGNAKSDKHAKDAFHLVESAKNGGRHFITNDRRLLKKAREIWAALTIRVLTPSQFLTDYYPHAETEMDKENQVDREREFVTAEELDGILTREIRKIEDLEDAKLTFQYRLLVPDETGCNWTGAVLNPGTRGSPQYGAPYAHDVVERARAKYNLKG